MELDADDGGAEQASAMGNAASRLVGGSFACAKGEARELGVAGAVRGPGGCKMSHAALVPEPSRSFGPHERLTVYSVLGLRVDALPGKSSMVRGAFGEENLGGKS
jgi:hypothetical protein